MTASWFWNSYLQGRSWRSWRGLIVCLFCCSAALAAAVEPVHDRIDWPRMEFEQGQFCGYEAEVSRQDCQARRDAQLFSIWPRPDAAALGAKVACQPAANFWKTEAIGPYAQQRGLSPSSLRYWILQRWGHSVVVRAS